MKKVSVNLSDEDVEELKRLAKKRNRTVTEILRQAIADQRFFDEKKEKGSKILIKDQGEEIQEIIFR